MIKRKPQICELVSNARAIPKRSENGYLMLELMLGTAVMGLVLVMAASIAKEGEDQSSGRVKAESLSSFTQLASQYFTANRDAIALAMTDGTEAAKYCSINLNADGTGGLVANSVTKHTCAFDATLLRAKGLWPGGMNPDVPGGRFVAIARQIYDTPVLPALPAPTGGVDVLVVLASPTGVLTPTTKDTRRTTELISSMTTLGGNGGIIPAGPMGNCTASRAASTYEACGNGWKVNLADFIATPQLNTFSAALPN